MPLTIASRAMAGSFWFQSAGSYSSFAARLLRHSTSTAPPKSSSGRRSPARSVYLSIVINSFFARMARCFATRALLSASYTCIVAMYMRGRAGAASIMLSASSLLPEAAPPTISVNILASLRGVRLDAAALKGIAVPVNGKCHIPQRDGSHSTRALAQVHPGRDKRRFAQCIQHHFTGRLR